MAKLNLAVAVGDYDRTRALIAGSVAIDGVDPVYMTLVPEEIFFRAFRAAEFDICELSLSSYTVKTAQNDCPYIAVPAFVSRAFRHTSVYVRTDRIKKPQDLKGRKVGVPEYQLTANVWARAFLEDDYGVKRSDIHWIRGGIEQAGRPEKITIKLPAGVRLDNTPSGATISGLLEAGDIDGFIAPRPPKSMEKGHPHVGWLFPDPTAVAKDYFKRTGFFPIMHVVGIRRELAERHPWLPSAVYKAFEQAKEAGLKKLSDTSASRLTARSSTISWRSITAKVCRRGASRWTNSSIPRLTRLSSCKVLSCSHASLPRSWRPYSRARRERRRPRPGRLPRRQRLFPGWERGRRPWSLDQIRRRLGRGPWRRDQLRDRPCAGRSICSRSADCAHAPSAPGGVRRCRRSDYWRAQTGAGFCSVRRSRLQ